MNISLKGLNELDESEICQVSGGGIADIAFGLSDFVSSVPYLASNTVAGATTAAQPITNGVAGTLYSLGSTLDVVTGPIVP